MIEIKVPLSVDHWFGKQIGKFIWFVVLYLLTPVTETL